MLNFCTLFNTGYLAKGLALHQSLVNTCAEFHLYIFAFDDMSLEILSAQKLANTTIISLNQFENDSLLKIKTERSVAEYCWTCTPFTIKFCLENFILEHCTYLDADTFFYTDPTPLINLLGNDAVLITPHNYHPKYDQSAMSGIYCVQFTTFKNNEQGLKVLNWWAKACLTWCYARYEDGKMGDQKYLDSWPYMFDGVSICRSIGAGLAPWNTLNFTFKYKDAFSINDSPVYFYHFHDLKHLSNNTWYLGGYEMPADVIEYIYKPYIKNLLSISADIKREYGDIDMLNTTDVTNVGTLNLKFKTGIYLLDIKTSLSKFKDSLFFNSRRKHYKSNYIKVQ